MLKELSHLAPHAHVLHLKNEDFSRDLKAVQAINEDPLIAHETQPSQTVAAMVSADERLKKEFRLITLPVLILHGTLDKNTKPSGSQHFYDMAGSTDKTLKLYEGGFHDLLNDIDKNVVMQDIKAGSVPGCPQNRSLLPWFRPRHCEGVTRVAANEFEAQTGTATARSLRRHPGDEPSPDSDPARTHVKPGAGEASPNTGRARSLSSPAGCDPLP